MDTLGTDQVQHEKSLAQQGVSFRLRTIPQAQTAKAALYYSKLQKKNLVLQIRETAAETMSESRQE